MEKSTYKNSIKSKEQIKKAVITLFKKKQSLSDITVSDVVKEADINRGTFYNHYSNIMQVIDEIQDELIADLTECFKLSAPIKDIKGFVHNLTKFLKKYEDTCQAIVKDLPRTVLDNFKTRFLEKLSTFQKNIDEFTALFIVNGLAGMYFNYFEGRINLSLEEVEKKSVALVETLLN